VAARSLPRLRPWLAPAFALLAGAALLAQEAPPLPADARPGSPRQASPAPVTSLQPPRRDPFRSRVLAPPDPRGARQGAPGPQVRASVQGTIRVPGRSPRALVLANGARFVVRAGDRIPLGQGRALEATVYLEILSVGDGYLEVKTGRTKWLLR